MFLTKIWMVSSASYEDDDVDESDDTLLDRLERMMSVSEWREVCGMLVVSCVRLPRRVSGCSSKYDE